MRACLDEAVRVLCREIRRGAGACGEVGNDGASLGAPSDGFHVMQHVLHRDAGGVGHAENDHAKGIADKDPIYRRLIDQARGGVIVSREDGEARSGGFGGLAGFGREVRCRGRVRRWVHERCLPLFGRHGDPSGIVQRPE